MKITARPFKQDSLSSEMKQPHIHICLRDDNLHEMKCHYDQNKQTELDKMTEWAKDFIIAVKAYSKKLIAMNEAIDKADECTFEELNKQTKANWKRVNTLLDECKWPIIVDNSFILDDSLELEGIGYDDPEDDKYDDPGSLKYIKDRGYNFTGHSI